MRILLAHHGPLDSDQIGRQVLVLARSLQAAGQDARILTIDDQDSAVHDSLVIRVTAGRAVSGADLPFARPSFASVERGGLDYCDLTDVELDTYRRVLRKRLDNEVHQFNPHVIHCQHIWVLGHLALETGVPYLLTAHAAELDALSSDPRYMRFAHQAAENAGRILASTKDLADRVAAMFPASTDRVRVVKPSCTAEIVEAYQAVLRERGVASSK